MPIASRKEAALTWYETALELYRGDLLLDREQLRVKHLETLDRTAMIASNSATTARVITNGFVPVFRRQDGGNQEQISLRPKAAAGSQDHSQRESLPSQKVLILTSRTEAS